MAFGDVGATGTDSSSSTLSITLGGTPVADDLNVCSYFTGATSIPATPSGFTESSKCTNTTNSDEGVIWFELVVDSGDNDISIASTGDEAMAVMTRFLGSFDSTPLDIDNDESGNSTFDDPWVSVVSGATAQAVEVMVGVVCQRHVTDHTGDETVRTGTATPTGNMTKTGTAATALKRVYQDHLVLTAAGTLGFDRDNTDLDILMGTYASFKEAAAAPAGIEIFRRRIEGYK